MELLFVLGTRPEAIKLAPVIREARRREAAGAPLCSLVVSTGQHREMLQPILASFGIEPDADLDLMQPGQTLDSLTSLALTSVSRFLRSRRPEAVLVQGDTTTAMAAALAAFYLDIDVAHVEAGLRTNDRRSPFPEEVNRRIIGQVARWHFPPTRWARENLEREGLVTPGSTWVTGNTGIDALHHQAAYHVELPFEPAGRRVILVTGHRRENFGAPFREFCLGLLDLANAHPDCLVVYPVHLNPNVQAPVRELLSGQRNILLVPPLDYPVFVQAMKSAHLIITDSGGVQEEAPALGVPVLVTRNTTERPEAVRAGGVRLVGPDRAAILANADELLSNTEAHAAMARTRSPYGDGRASARIISALLGEEVTEFA